MCEMPLVSVRVRTLAASDSAWVATELALPDQVAAARASLGEGALFSIDPEAVIPLEANSRLSQICSVVPVYLHGAGNLVEAGAKFPAPGAAPSAKFSASSAQAEDPLAFASPEAREEAAKPREQILGEWRCCIPAAGFDAVAEACSWSELTVAQKRALVHCRRNAAITSRKARAPFTARLLADKVSAADVETLFAWFQHRARITINVSLAGKIAHFLEADGEYHSMFAAAHRGGVRCAESPRGKGYVGRRALWERKIFGPAYGEAYTPPGKKFGADPHGISCMKFLCGAEERPKYGALNFRGLPGGAAPHFGGSFFELRQHVRCRTTFTHGDSSGTVNVSGIATSDHMCAVVAMLTPDALRCAMAAAKGLAAPKQTKGPYIEAQIHGRLLLRRDVARAVLCKSDDTKAVRDGLDVLGIPFERWQKTQ